MPKPDEFLDEIKTSGGMLFLEEDLGVEWTAAEFMPEASNVPFIRFARAVIDDDASEAEQISCVWISLEDLKGIVKRAEEMLNG